jgi:H+/Cl- antiporter ClcA
MVYLHEIAPARAKGLVGSIGFASAMVGCMLGVLIVVIVEAIFSPGEQAAVAAAAAAEGCIPALWS